MRRYARTRRKNAHPEHDAQVALFAWAKLNEVKYPELALLFAVPNGMRTSMRTAIKAKAEGLKAGVPDVWLPVGAAGKFPNDYDPDAPFFASGLVIEMKAPKGKTSILQRRWLEELHKQGYITTVCYSAAEATLAICDYLNIPKEKSL